MANSFLHIEGRDSREPARRMVMAAFSFTLALLLPQDQSNIPTLSPPGLLRRGVAPRDAAESQAFTDVPDALVHVAVDRAKLTRTVEPRYRAAIRPYDLTSGIASGAALRVEHRGRELKRVDGARLDGAEHLGPTEVGVPSRLAVCIPSGDGLLQHRGGQSQGLRQGCDRLGMLDPALRQLGSIVIAPVIALDDWIPPGARLFLAERTRGEHRVIEDHEHRAWCGKRRPAPSDFDLPVRGLVLFVRKPLAVRA